MLRLFLILALLAAPASASAQVLRSDLPLWGGQPAEETVSPSHFTDEKTFGCRWTFKLGDWKWLKAGANQPHEWLQVQNYGVFHCAGIFRSALRQPGLGDALHEYGFVVDLGEADGAEGRERIVALQIGTWSGSRYVLLAAPAGEQPGQAKRYRLLEPKCPDGALRDGGRIDIFRTAYCVARDRDALRAMAREAVGRKSDQWLVWVND